MAADEQISVSPAAEFEAHLERGVISLQHCTACGRTIFYPRNICPHCHGRRLVWREIGGGGTVYACTVINRKAEKGGAYNVVLVDVEEGARLMSRVENMRPEDIRIGQRVTLRVAEAPDGPIILCVASDGEGGGSSG